MADLEISWANMTDLEYLDANLEMGELVVLCSNQINIGTFVHQMGETHTYLPSGEQT